ncbi:growth arrest-specific protein 1-like [Arapaima gigas]
MSPWIPQDERLRDRASFQPSIAVEPELRAAMSFMVKYMVGGQLKNLTGGLGEEKSENEKSEASAKGMTEEEFEQYQQQLVEEKMERDASFAQRKAERATVRTHFRDKYRLPKNELDETQIQQAGHEVELPTELAKMITDGNQQDVHRQSILGQLSNIQNVNLDQLKDKAQTTLEDLRHSAGKCSLIAWRPGYRRVTMKRWPVALAFLSGLLVLDARYVCWQAVLRCQQESDCELAYTQYLAACEANIRGQRRHCPSHCIGALVRLNQTRSGPDLETCDCGQDPQCRRTKRAIEPCLPRRYPTDRAGIGCTEARQRCEEEPACQASLTDYLSNCGQLFNGRRCTAICRSTIERMLFIPSGALLKRCVCDGVERPFCQVVKENMDKLCSIGDQGFSTTYRDADDLYEDEDYDSRMDREENQLDSAVSFSNCSPVSASAIPLSAAAVLTVCRSAFQ